MSTRPSGPTRVGPGPVPGRGCRRPAYGANEVTARDWDSDATRGVASFLLGHRSDGRPSCMLDYCSFFWLAPNEQLEPRLLPQYAVRPAGQSLAGLDFSRRAGFRGPVRASPPCTGTPLAVTKSDEGFGVVFECPLLRYIRGEHPRYLVVSGSAACRGPARGNGARVPLKVLGPRTPPTCAAGDLWSDRSGDLWSDRSVFERTSAQPGIASADRLT
jgi:hypothetical protein